MYQYKSMIELSEQWQEIVEMFEESGGELTEELELKWKTVSDNRAELVDTLANIIAEQSDRVVRYKRERVRLQAKEDSILKSIDGVKKLLLQTVSNFGDTGKSGNKSIKTEVGTYFTKVAKSVSIVDISIIPEEFKKYTITAEFTNKDSFQAMVSLAEASGDFVKMSTGESVDKDKIKFASKDSDIPGTEKIERTDISIR